MKRLLYLVGEPGAGKSTLLAAALVGVPSRDVAHPFAHRVLNDGAGVELGAHRDKFSGTDALGMSAIEIVIPWLFAPAAPELVVGEGDRLSCDRFFVAVQAAGYVLSVAQVMVRSDVAAERRRARARALGVPEQNAAWVKGRRSKADTLAAKWADPALLLVNDGDPVRAIGKLMAHPVIAGIRRSAT